MSERRVQPRKPGQQRGAPHSPLPRLDSERATRELKSFLELAMREGGFALEWEISLEPVAEDGQGGIVVAFRGEDEPLLLERNAELLLALEYIAHRWLRLDPRLHDHVRFDCGGYRAERLDELKLSAKVAAQRVRETGEPFRFNPMSSRERRLIHLELANANDVRTVSEGSGDRRQLVIYPVTRKSNRTA
ncbi:MAG TPA: R3H domain-containing nucleic acid-binding protein [Candidatus Aquilonibacter sp.]|nr:R3H domain-containing nucleic acid-binding protein [Candidatus Aquilonibacter sp.]